MMNSNRGDLLTILLLSAASVPGCNADPIGLKAAAAEVEAGQLFEFLSSLQESAEFTSSMADTKKLAAKDFLEALISGVGDDAGSFDGKPYTGLQKKLIAKEKALGAAGSSSDGDAGSIAGSGHLTKASVTSFVQISAHAIDILNGREATASFTKAQVSEALYVSMALAAFRSLSAHPSLALKAKSNTKGAGSNTEKNGGLSEGFKCPNGYAGSKCYKDQTGATGFFYKYQGQLYAKNINAAAGDSGKLVCSAKKPNCGSTDTAPDNVDAKDYTSGDAGSGASSTATGSASTTGGSSKSRGNAGSSSNPNNN